MDELNRLKNRRGRSRSKNRDLESSNQNNNSIYIGGAILAGAILVYSGLKLLFQSKKSDEKELIQTDVKTQKTQVNPTPKNETTDKNTPQKEEALQSNTSKSFAKTSSTSNDKKNEEEKLKEFAKSLEKQKLATKNLTKRVLKILDKKETEAFKCEQSKKKKNSHLIFFTNNKKKLKNKIIVPTDLSLKQLNSLEELFNSLEENLKKLIYHIFHASWISSFIVTTQTNSKELFELLITIFTNITVDDLRKMCCEETTNGIKKEEFEEFLNYSAQVMLNLGNYHFQDRIKFIPNLPKESFEKIISIISLKHPTLKKDLDRFYQSSASFIFDVTPTNFKIGQVGSDASPYYSGEISYQETLLSEQDVLNTSKYISENLINSCLIKTNKTNEGISILIF